MNVARHSRGRNATVSQILNLSRCFNKAFLSKQARKEEIPSVVTSSNDVLSVSERDLGKLYVTPRREFEKIFPHGLQTSFMKEVQSSSQAGILVRKPALDIINHLRNHSQSNTSPMRFIINGPDGCGKTLTLAHIIHYCCKANWLVVQIPSVFEWVYSRNKVRHNMHDHQTFDQPQEALEWLRNFKTLNASHLTHLKTTSKHTWGKVDVTKSGQPLGVVVDQGLQKPMNATDAISVLLREIAKVKDRKILFAVDEFNGLFGTTSVQDPDKQLVHLKSLNLISHFQRLLTDLLSANTSATVASLSRTGMLHTRSRGFGLRDLLPHTWLQQLKPYVNIRVEEYSDDEMTSILEYYAHIKWLVASRDQKTVTEIRFLTQRKPFAVQKICSTC